MFKTNNPYIPKNEEKEEGYNTKLLLNNAKVLSLVFSLFLAISYVLPFLLYKSLSSTIVIIFLITSFILSLLSFFLNLLIKNKPKTIEIIISVLFVFSLGFFLGIFSEYFRNLILNNMNSYDGYILIIATSSIILSILVISFLEYVFGPYIKNFFFVMLIGYTLIFIILFVISFALSKNVFGFSLMKNLMSGSLVSLYFTFLCSIYFENIKNSIFEGINKKDIVKASLSPLSLVLWFPIDFVRLVIFSFKKTK